LKLGKLQKYTSPDQVVERLHQLILGKTHGVLWPLQFVLAALAALLLSGLTEQSDPLIFACMTAFIFIVIDVLQRWRAGHIYPRLQLEAAFLEAHYHELSKTNLP